MNEDKEIKNSQTFDSWGKLEKQIKTKESIIVLIIVLLSFVFIPLKILNFGWTPSDDALRHVAFSTIDANWTDIVIIDEKYSADHNAGWHKILKFLYKYCSLKKEQLLLFSVFSLFLLVNICGIICSPSPISWCISLLLLLNIESNDVSLRMLSGRPLLFSSAATIALLRIWCIDFQEKKSNNLFNKNWAIYLISIIILSLSVWIHGGWYLFLLIPLSIFISGRAQKAFKFTLCLFISTLIGALLSGDFYNFLRFHFLVAYTVFNEPTYNWLLATEFATGIQETNWIAFTAIITFFSVYKKHLKLSDLTQDPIFIMVLLCWMGSICVIRFWSDWGLMALLIWLSYRFNEIIKSSDYIKTPRARYCLFLFLTISLVFCFISDTNGKYTKPVLSQPIDFYDNINIERLKGWEPQEDGIVYSTIMSCFYQHFYKYPTAKWKYILGFEPAIMNKEDKILLRNIGFSGLEEDYAPWINKMTEKDRLIIDRKLESFPQLEWIRGNRIWWIGRLKKRRS